MLLKPADAKDGEIADIEARLADASGAQKAILERELKNLRAGIRGERDAAYLIDFHLAASKRTAVIHDLRLEINGRVAQIDHLLIHRTLNVFVLETKHFHAGVKITEEGEFLRWNDFARKFEGMESPLAQNDRHIAVLKDAFDAIEMPTRMGLRMTPTFVSFVVVSPNARIDRPRRFDTSRIIKADMVLQAVEAKLENEGVLESLAGLSRFVSGETVMEIGRKLIALHKPASRRGDTSSTADVRTSAAKAVQPTPASHALQPASPLPASNGSTSCRACNSSDLTILHGKYGYYFKCRACSGNTPIKLNCGRDGHQERLRKSGLHFYRECADCGTSTLYFQNPE